MPTSTPTKTKRVTKKVAVTPPPPVASNGNRGQIQVRLPQDLIDRLDVEADRRRVSKTFLVEQALAVMVPKFEEQSIDSV
jgi:predicted HicB family RNase H-like nuclease